MPRIRPLVFIVVSLLWIIATVAEPTQAQETTQPWADQQQKLKPVKKGEGFGEIVAMNEETIAVAASYASGIYPDAPNLHAGKVYIFKQIDDRWQLTDEVHPPFDELHPPTDEYKIIWFGSGLWLDGNVMVVHGRANSRAGLYIFRQNNDAWNFEAKIDNPADYTNMVSSSISISNNTIMVKMSTMVTVNDWLEHVYIYEFNGETWELYQILEQPYEIPPEISDGSAFGNNIDIENDVAMINCAEFIPAIERVISKICVYVREADGWHLTQTLQGPESTFSGYGQRSISNDVMGAVATYRIGEGRDLWYQRRLHIYERVDNQWLLQADIIPEETSWQDSIFRVNLDADNGRIVVNAVIEEWGNFNVRDVAYVYEKANGTWSRTVKLVAFSFNESGRTNSNIVILGETVVAGTRGLDEDVEGNALIFKIPGVEEVEEPSALFEVPDMTATTTNSGFITYNVKLKTRPTKNVNLRLKTDNYTLLDNGGIASEQLTLTFNRWNWNKPQSVRVRASNTAVPEGVVTSKIKRIIQKDSAIEYLPVTPPNERVEIPTDTFAAVAPIADAIVDTLPATFVWNPYSLATKYRIYVKGNGVGVKYNFDKSVNATKFCTADLCSFTLNSLTKPLPENASLRWRVVAMDVPAKFSKSSGWQTFSTAIASSSLRGN